MSKQWTQERTQEKTGYKFGDITKGIFRGSVKVAQTSINGAEQVISGTAGLVGTVVNTTADVTVAAVKCTANVATGGVSLVGKAVDGAGKAVVDGMNSVGGKSFSVYEEDVSFVNGEIYHYDGS